MEEVRGRLQSRDFSSKARENVNQFFQQTFSSLNNNYPRLFNFYPSLGQKT